MAFVSANVVDALDLRAVDFLWGPQRSYTAAGIVVPSGILTGTYSGSLLVTAQLPTGTLAGYTLDYGTRHALTIDGVSVDAGAFFRLVAAGDDSSAMALLLSGDDSIFGSSRDDYLVGYAGDDSLAGMGGHNTLDGGSGHDSALCFSTSSSFTISVGADMSATVVDRLHSADTDTLRNVELVSFNDRDVDLTTIAAPFKAWTVGLSALSDLIQMYVAYFNRAPDTLGVGYWASRLEQGMSLEQIAKSFFVQPETLAAFPASMTTTAFVTKVYENVLGRAPDAPGLAYWIHDLDQGMGRDVFMLAMIYGARSPTGGAADTAYVENKGAVGAYFALTRGLSDGAWAADVMQGVDSTAASVAAAAQKTDAYVATAQTTAPHLLLPLVGVDFSGIAHS